MKTIKFVFRWWAVALLACTAFVNSAMALAVPEMLPLEYMAARLTTPSVSPFQPFNISPQPVLDFRPLIQPQNKPGIKTPGDLANWGYSIYQSWAHKENSKDYYDWYTGEYAGSGYDIYEWDVTQGFRKVVSRQWMDGTWSYYDSGFAFGSANAWDREKCGWSREVLVGAPDPTGYSTDLQVDVMGTWMIRNWGNSTQPDFEVAICWPVIQWPWDMHRSDAYPMGLVESYDPWRVIVLPRGTSEDITPWESDVPKNYEFRAYPYVILDWRTVASNNSSLPEWVEGWE